MNNDLKRNQTPVYQSRDGALAIKAYIDKNNIWLTQPQMAMLFGTQRPAITKHLKNIFLTGELKKESVSSILEHTAKDGKRYKTAFYNLDAIISIGYRINSLKATQFRIWATKVLRSYLLKNYAINHRQIKNENLLELEDAVKLIRNTIEAKQLTSAETKGMLDVVTRYANVWILLQRYDEGKIKKPKGARPSFKIDISLARSVIADTKRDLIERKIAQSLFGVERNEMLEGILANLYQTFGGQELYASIEEKAANLLYQIIKDHPFVDGNKRIASLLFIIFLGKNNYLLDKQNERKFNDNALVAIALLVAQSDPLQKEVMIKLIMNFVKG